jgi:hypothetical protein
MIWRELDNWAVTNNKSTLVSTDFTREDASTSKERSLELPLATSTIQPVPRQSTSAIKRKTPGIGAEERSAIKCPELTMIVFIRTHILDFSAVPVTTWKDGFITYNLESVNLTWVSSFRHQCRSTISAPASSQQRPILWFVSKTTSARWRKVASAASASERNAGIGGVKAFIRIFATTRQFIFVGRREV